MEVSDSTTALAIAPTITKYIYVMFVNNVYHKFSPKFHEHTAAVKRFWKIDGSASDRSDRWVNKLTVDIHQLVVRQLWSGDEGCCHTSSSVPH